MKRLLTIISLISAINLMAKEYSDSKPLTNSEIQNEAELNVKCEDYENLFQTPDYLSFKPVKERGFEIHNPYGLLMLSIPQHSQNPLSGSAKVKVKISYQIEKFGVTDWREVYAELEVNIDPENIKDADYVKIEGALRMKVSKKNPRALNCFLKLS